MAITINDHQWLILKTLIKAQEFLTQDQLISRNHLDNAIVSATFLYGQEKGWLEIREIAREELILTETAASQIAKGFPERQVLSYLVAQKKVPIKEFVTYLKDKDLQLNDIIKWGTLRNWITKDKGEIIITTAGKNAVDQEADDEKALKVAIPEGSIFLDELDKSINLENVKNLLKNRNSVVKIKARTLRLAKITSKGLKELQEDKIKIVQEKNILTSEDLLSGNWQNIKLRHYDVKLEAEKVYPVKINLMQKIIQQTRNAFLEMGFEEIVSSQVESSFWDFDALFQPQDHPARDMQDTFYLENPAKAKLPSKDIINKVKATHENGGDTGSTGWGYKWNEEKAKEMILRTHTTAASIREIAKNPNPPRKVFCVGKVFRNEAISYKHLPEFFQIDGIVIDKNASLATLLGTIKEFYRKMGFEKIKFKPSFFPYTEPSVEIFVYMESKQKWIELGGAGVFRPEVTRPFGCNVPVLAWGFGLERLAMLRYGLKDIRELYWSDFDKIKEVALCQ
ncbi:phenylalanine--tRNA ligase subunit alpha [bacterium]|mgnify:CR=1 FL=1|jgi:phenylalanyl-tRNA synthetase alpha chain|nr:phenylalanine--tRNA ligase subunit alpha [bacterium]MBT3581476.1 phenylalanine--tRNA ligase subunit alpha [bacterium]MBT4551490.1 phenylalanine--tRNA ligase subunit alpha [bacterium]MBT7088610.1 phenylalanine--tRNA ligase subunit alpha [bacterium]